MDSQNKNGATTRKPISFRRSLLTIWFANLSLLVLLILLVAYVFAHRQEFSVRGEAQNRAFRRVEAIRDRLAREAISQNTTPIESWIADVDWIGPTLEDVVRADDVFNHISVISLTGETILQRRATASPSSRPGGTESGIGPGTDRAATQSAVSRRPQPGVSLHVMTVVADGVKVGSVQVGLSQDTMYRRVIESRRPLLQVASILGVACVAILLASGISVVRLVRRMRALYDESARRDRLTAIGKVSRRIVHEIRNPLNAMRMQVAVIRRKIAKSDPQSLQVANDQLHSLEEEIARIERFAKSFLEAGNLPHAKPEVIAPATVLREIVDLMRSEFEEISARVVLDFKDRADVLRVRMDPTRLRRAILNIIKNAREAMSEGDLLSIRLTRCSKRALQIDFEDTGCGIPREELADVFDVHYSTKSDGSGLGLAIVRHIIEEAGGSVSVRSGEGQGTTVTIRLPFSRN